MHFIQKPLRYAHSEGHTNVCFSDDGKYIVTCGSEGDVRIWNGFDDEEPVDKCVGDKAYAVVVKGGVMYVGTSNNYVQSFTFPEAELDGIVTRFKAPVTSIDALSNGKTVVSGSQDMEIHVYKDGSLANVLTEHKAPILSVAVDPKGEYFASSSCDGTVKVWKLSDENKEVVSNWDCVPKSNSVETSHTLCKISWTPVTGRVLAVPYKSEIVLYERDTWKKITSLTIPSADEKQLFSVCSISECGKYLAASSTDKKVHVWNINKGKLEFTVETKESVVCSIVWRPGSGNCEKYELVFCNNEGYLGLVECNPNVESDNIMNDIEMDVAHKEIELNDDVVNKLVDDDGDGEFAISVDKIKADLGFNPDGSMREDRGRSRSRSRSGSRSRSVSRSRSRSPSAVVPRIDMQPPFQPSSTPTCLQYRFMAWNDVGIIEQTNTEDDHAISVKFHDSSFHYPLRISNDLNYSMGTLSSEAAVFASEKVEDKSSYFGCHPFKKGPEWFTELPEDEEAVAVAAGIGWVAVATSMQTLRLYTVGGNRREVVSLPGPVVCLSGHKNILAASFHTSTGVGGHQWLGFLLMEIRSADICKYIIPPQSLPVTPRSTLKWMGFSDCGALCTSDSSGFVRLFTSKQGWHPICNTTRHVNGKSDHYFVLGVNEYLQRVKVILCKGSDYPPVIPAPYMTELPWKLPLCGLHEEKGGLEETLWRSKLAAHCLSTCQFTNDEDYGLSDAQKKNTVEINRTTMRLFSMACMENHTLRAFEICQLSNSTLLLQHAMQYAHAQNKTLLAEQIAELLAEKKAQEENGTADNTSLNMYSHSLPDRTIQVLTPWPSVTDRYTERRLHQNEFHHTIVTADSEMSFENSSQDIFAEPSENRLNSSTSDVTKKVLSPYAGRLSSSKEDANVKRRYAFNPFKKVAANTTDLTKSPASALRMKSKGEKEKLNISDEFSSPKSNLPPFKEWFNTEKENFQKDNPNLSIAQITKIALKKYKELKISNSFSVATPNSKDTSIDTNNCTNESNSEEVVSEADTPLQDINRKRKLSESNDDNEEKILETKNKKLDESSKKNLKSNKKQTEENQVKKGVVKSASKLTGFFHKK